MITINTECINQSSILYKSVRNWIKNSRILYTSHRKYSLPQVGLLLLRYFLGVVRFTDVLFRPCTQYGDQSNLQVDIVLGLREIIWKTKKRRRAPTSRTLAQVEREESALGLRTEKKFASVRSTVQMDPRDRSRTGDRNVSTGSVRRGLRANADSKYYTTYHKLVASAKHDE